MAVDEISIRRAVRDHYGELAQTGKGSGCRCGPAPSQADATPSEASQVYDGCGSPIEAAAIKEGEVVVDLGSGGGLDVFRASNLVGESGYVIGVDATPEMVWRARETAKKHAYSNVEFRLGEIEHTPIDSNWADVIVSNCVINLAPYKDAVFREAYRTLKPGGRLVISDTVMECTLKIDPKNLNAQEQCLTRTDVDSWAECVAGALPEDEYVDLIKRTGFVDIDVKGKTQSCCSQGIASITITATKPEKPQANTR
jgi:ubiquinone/menaquinone biosynthesis C-methylase UbiE